MIYKFSSTVLCPSITLQSLRSLFKWQNCIDKLLSNDFLYSLKPIMDTCQDFILTRSQDILDKQIFKSSNKKLHMISYWKQHIDKEMRF